MMWRRSWITLIVLLGLIFLYAPIIVMVVYSFNASRLVGVWGGWSFHWYHVLFHDDVIGQAAWLSIRVAVLSASIGLMLGVILAVIFKRFGWFRGRLLLYGMTVTPLVMPDVVTGLALLLLFISVNHLLGLVHGSILGFWTIVVAHITFCTAYATIVVQARVHSLDKSLEEAANDLGAKPTKTFFWITLPQILPSLFAAWMMAFTLSIDDLVITSFVSGSSQSTLPMYIFATLKTGVSPEVNALATVLIAIVMCFLTVGYIAFLRTQRKKR